MADPAPNSQQPKGIDELRKNPDSGLEAVPGGDEGDGQPQGNLQSVPTPKPGVDVGGVPTQKPTTAPGPQKPAIPGGGRGTGKPSERLAPVPEAQPAPAAAPATRPVRPTDAPPVDTNAVGEPLSEALPDEEEEDDQDNNQPDPRDFRSNEPESEEPENEGAESESGSPQSEGESSEQTGEEASAEAESTEVAGSEAAGGAEAGAGAAEAGAGAGAAEGGAAAAGTAAEVGGAAATSEIWVPVALVILVIILCIIGFVVIAGMAGGATNGGSGSANQSGSAANNFGNANGFPFPKGSGFGSPDTWSLDQGVDITAPGGTPELALGDGTIVSRGIGGFGDWAPVLKLDSPISGKYQYVYYGHAGCGKNDNGPTDAGQKGHGTPQCPEVGAKVKQGDQIAVVGFGAVGISTGPHIEIGFSDAAGTPVGPQTSGDMKAYLLSHVPK